MNDTFVIARLDRVHDRSHFSCGVPALDHYLKERAGQDVRKRMSNCFVATVKDTNAVAGFYTLSATALDASWVPEEVRKRLPRYPVLPATLVGRLAVDNRFRGQGLGEALLFDAVHRAMTSDPAIYAIVVEAKDDRAGAFYLHYDFRPVANEPRMLFLPLEYFEN